MRRSISFLVVIAAAGAMAAPAAAATPKDFTVFAKTTRSEEVKGGVWVFEETLRDGLRGERVGRSKYRCRRVAGESRCRARFRFSDGMIVGRGRVGETTARVRGESKASTLPLVDGTGRYAGARGKLIFNAVTKRRSELRFNFKR